MEKDCHQRESQGSDENVASRPTEKIIFQGNWEATRKMVHVHKFWGQLC